MAVLVAAAGLMHANGQLFFAPAFWSLFAIAALVGGSSALNMYLERVQDQKMERTKDRALAAGRLPAFWGVFVGVVCTASACFLLYQATNPLTLLLGVISLVLYVFCYTPLKQKTWISLIIGSIPGAMPVALGYISLANEIDIKALALFLWAFLWQIPHFLAISLFREKEYTAAGFPVLSACAGVNLAKKILLFSSWLLVFSTFGLFLSHIITSFWFFLCIALGVAFLWVCHQGIFTSDTDTWARKVFKASLLYQGMLFIILIASAFI